MPLIIMMITTRNMFSLTMMMMMMMMITMIINFLKEKELEKLNSVAMSMMTKAIMTY